jgi:hypothetical protein
MIPGTTPRTNIRRRLFSPGTTLRVFTALLGAFAAAQSPAAANDTPLVRSVYETPLPSDPLVLWERVQDLRWLNRREDAKTLEAYLERTAVSLILGEKPQTAPTLAQSLQMQRTVPPLGPAQIARVFALFDGVLDDTTVQDSVPKDYRGQIQYHYEGHSVWSQVRDPHEAYLHIGLTNHSGHDVDSLSASVHIVDGSESIEIPCHALISSVLRDGATASALCPTAQVTSTARPGLYTRIDTAALIAHLESVEHGEATVAIEPDEASFPQYSVGVSAAGVQPVNVSLRSRTFPLLTDVTCEDRGTCAAERSDKLQHALFSPLPVLFVSLFASFGITYLVLRTIVRVGGGAGALLAARLIGAAVVLAGLGTAAWNWHALENYHGGGWGGLPYFVILVGAAVFSIGALIATLLVRGRPAAKPAI